MSANQETQEGEENDRLFPILDRRTPIIDRIRQRREQLNGTSNNDLAHQIARSALTGESIEEEFLSNLRADIADELDIRQDQIDGLFLSRVRDVLSPSIDEIINQKSIDSSDMSDTDDQNNNDDNNDEIVENEDQESDDDSGPAFPSTSDEDENDDEDEAEEIF